MAGQKINYSVIAAAKDGNVAALGFIIECYRGSIDRQVHDAAPWLSRECLKECCQDVYMALMKLIITKFTL